MQLEFFDIAQETADVMPAAMSLPVPDICAQYLGELKLAASRLISVEELTQINLAGSNSTQTMVGCQISVTSLPVPDTVSAILHGTEVCM